MKYLLPLVLLSSVCYGQEWIETKSFKSYYFPGDYREFKYIADSFQGGTGGSASQIVHDTIYIDSCRLRIEQAKKIRDSIENATANMSDYIIIWGRDTLNKYLSGPILSDPSLYSRVVNGKTIFKYRDRWHHSRSSAPVKKRVKHVRVLPTEIMIKMDYYMNDHLVKTAYKREYGAGKLSFKYPTNSYTVRNGKNVSIDSIHFQIYKP